MSEERKALAGSLWDAIYESAHADWFGSRQEVVAALLPLVDTYAASEVRRALEEAADECDLIYNNIDLSVYTVPPYGEGVQDGWDFAEQMLRARAAALSGPETTVEPGIYPGGGIAFAELRPAAHEFVPESTRECWHWTDDPIDRCGLPAEHPIHRPTSATVYGETIRDKTASELGLCDD